MAKNITRVALIGPESSGKSTLCRELSEHFNGVVVDEYAREFIPQLQGAYTLENVIFMYQQQWENEYKLINSTEKILFADTEFINGLVWCETVFNIRLPWFDQMIRDHPYDFYLLTAPDLEWEPDPLRENPGKGQYFFDRYRQELEVYNLPYGLVHGTGEARSQSAIEILKKVLSGKL